MEGFLEEATFKWSLDNGGWGIFLDKVSRQRPSIWANVEVRENMGLSRPPRKLRVAGG